MQAGKQPLEQRTVEGKAKSTLAATFQGKRDDGKARGVQPASENASAERRDLLQRLKDIAPRCEKPCEPPSSACARTGSERRKRPQPAAVADGGCRRG
jgi:hypothetical protein